MLNIINFSRIKKNLNSFQKQFYFNLFFKTSKLKQNLIFKKFRRRANITKFFFKYNAEFFNYKYQLFLIKFFFWFFDFLIQYKNKILNDIMFQPFLEKNSFFILEKKISRNIFLLNQTNLSNIFLLKFFFLRNYLRTSFFKKTIVRVDDFPGEFIFRKQFFISAELNSLCSLILNYITSVSLFPHEYDIKYFFYYTIFILKYRLHFLYIFNC